MCEPWSGQHFFSFHLCHAHIYLRPLAPDSSLRLTLIYSERFPHCRLFPIQGAHDGELRFHFIPALKQGKILFQEEGLLIFASWSQHVLSMSQMDDCSIAKNVAQQRTYYPRQGSCYEYFGAQ